MAVKQNNFRRLLLTFEALAELGPQLTLGYDFGKTASAMLSSVMEAMTAREGALFSFQDKPALLTSIAAQGFGTFPQPATIPLLPKQVHALVTCRSPQALFPKSCEEFLSSNGNVSPELFKCIGPLRAGPKLVGLIALGRRDDDAIYDTDELEALGLLCNYVALAVQNHVMSDSLERRVAENLRLLASMHTFYDNALEAFAAAIEVKHENIRGHSLRVGRYASGIGEALGLDASEVAGLRAAGYLHDIGKVAVDKHIFGKKGALDPGEFRQMADHTVVGHQIVSGVQFPWPKIPEIVRGHHERADGSGYPDKLRNHELDVSVRLVAVADTFDAMTSERPYRRPLPVGEVLSEIVRITPQKFDADAVQGLLVQVRRDAVATCGPLLGQFGADPGHKGRFLDDSLICNIAPADVDQLAASLQHRLNRMRVYSA